MNKIAGLRTVIYKVPDIDAAKSWYSRAFETDPNFDQPFYVGFEIDGYELGLQPSPGTDSKGESVAAYWATDDVQATFDRLIGLGAIAYEAPQNVGGDIIVATVKDPWENVIGLIYNPHFKKPGR